MSDFIDKIEFNDQGLIPVIAQSAQSKEVLMLAWMNKEAVEKTIDSGQMHYWSRSRGKLWKKGEESGHTQKLKQHILDCDGDTLLAMVDQKGVACHTGRRTCFFSAFKDGQVAELMKPEVNPEDIYD